MIVVLPKVYEFPFKVSSVPEEYMVKVFTANGSDEALYEGMRDRCIRYGFNLVYTKNPQVLMPLMVSEQGIVVSAEIFRNTLGGDSCVEHST